MFFWRQLCLMQFFILLAFFLFMGLTPAPETYAPTFNDKFMHFSGYFIAAFSISFAYPQRSIGHKAIFLIVFSIAIEIGQYFMPPRAFDLLDICANSAGVLTGLAVVTVLAKKIFWFKKFLYLALQ